jgi:PfaD family protein
MRSQTRDHATDSALNPARTQLPEPGRRLWTRRANAAMGEQALRCALSRLDLPCYAFQTGTRVGIAHELCDAACDDAVEVQAFCPPSEASELGSSAYRAAHGVRFAYQAGAMANGIASEELVIALGRAGILASFGAAGLLAARVQQAIARIQRALPEGPYAFNLIHSPSEQALEKANVELFLKHRITTVEASAYLKLTPHVVHYRVAGLRKGPDGRPLIGHRIIAKISRAEVATHFMEPPPEAIVRDLCQRGLVSAEQAELARLVPMADDVTVEADSGGHTDNRPLVATLPMMRRLLAKLQARHDYAQTIRVGAGGGIGTPEAAMAAFALGADYVVTGSINQACLQAGTSESVRRLLAQAGLADFCMAPAADMFELGVKLQVLKRGTMFAMRANRLYELYRAHDSMDAIPQAERAKLEQQIFRAGLEEIWQQCIEFFSERDPEQLRRAQENSKRKMALVFRWYLGMSSRWANSGEPGREADYQIWAGPALGAFNDWTAGTYLADYRRRDVRDVAEHVMLGAATLQRAHSLRLQGITLPLGSSQYVPERPLVAE